MSNEIQISETLELDIATALERAKIFKVTDDETRLKASESRKQVKQWENAIETKFGPQKEKLYRPYKDLLDEIKGLNDTLKSLDGIFKKGIEDYDREVEKKRQEAIKAEEARLAEQRRIAAEAEAQGKPVPQVELAPKIEIPAAAPRSAGEYEVEVWEYEVVDFALVPNEYKVLDVSKVGAIVKVSKNLTSIPGIKVTSRKDVRQRA